MKSQKIPAVVKRTAFRVFVLVLTAVMLITSGTVNAQMFDRLQAMYDLAQQTFTLAPEEGVTVELSGMMPKGGSATAVPAETEDEDVIHAYDITILYQDGREFEPDNGEPISVSFMSNQIAEALKDDETLEVAHIPDNGEEEDVALTSAGGDTATFEAESFSVYLIRTHAGDSLNHNPRRIYHFLSPDFTVNEEDDTSYQAPEYLFPNKVNEMVSVQAIRTGESLQEIVMPENKTNGVFYGWYVVQVTGTKEVEVDGKKTTMYTYRWTGESQERVSFNEPISFESDGDKDIYLAPVYARYRFLTFHQDTENSGSDNANIIVCRKLIILNDEHKCTLSISDVRAPSPSPNKTVFVGWKYTHTAGDNYNQGTGEGGKIEEHVTVNHEGEEIPTSITIEDTRNLGSDATETSLIYDIWPIFKEARWVEFDSGGNGATYRPAQFILLDDDTTGFNNAPVKSGFTFDGWYYEADNGNEVKVTDSNANIITGVTKQLTTGMSIDNGKLKMTSDAEESSAHRIFRARWTPSAQATFAVIVWKQKVTDTKNSGQEGYPAKTYDFAGYFPLEGQTLSGATGVDPRTTTAYTNYEGGGKGFEKFNETRNDQNADNNFIGFHFDHSTVSDDGYNHPTYEGKINPDGSTVVNVYYDRDLMKITFHYMSSAVTGGTASDGYVYLQTSDNTGEQFGLVNGEYVPLSVSVDRVNQGYSFSKKYTQSSAENADMYGIVNGEYVKLTRVDVSTWKKSGTKYTRVDPTTNSSGNSNQYYLDGSGFKTLVPDNSLISPDPPYFHNSKWWRSRSFRLFSGFTYSNEITDAYTVSTISKEAYSGTRYVISNSALSATTSNTNNPKQYGTDDDGNIYELEYTHDHYYYTYNNSTYSGDRYSMTADNTFYTGTLYKKTSEGFVATTDDSGTVYGSRTEGVYEELTKQGYENVYTWTTSDGSEYTGTRYLRFRRTSDSSFPYEVVWEGLYGRTFAQNGYSFPTKYRWTEEKNGGTGQTMLSSFTMLNSSYNATEKDYHLYHQGDAEDKIFYHLCQKLDGTYTKDDPSLCFETHGPANDDFIFDNKFTGFTVYAYSQDFYTDPDASGTIKTTVTAGVTKTSTNNFSYVYHKRRKDLELMFNDNFDGGENYSVKNLKYGQSIAGYHDVYEPEEREHYTFAGWYEDSAGTQPFDFDTVIYSSKIVYAKWNKERYRIKVDPNGGEMPLGSNTATFFNVDFDELVGQYADLRRNYVEENNGDYVYANFQYDKVAGAPGLGGSDLAAVYRKAFYIDKTKIEDEYNRVFTVNGVEYSYAQSGLTFEEFKSCIDMNRLYARADDTISYELVSWHKVRADGTVETLPFNFKAYVTEDTTIRARWFEHGGYSLVYDATSGGVTGTMARNIDPIDQQRKYADKASVVVLYEPSNLRTVGQGGQEEEASEYIFRGWRIVDGVTQEPLENNVFYDPGETMVLDASHADHQGVIHMKAYYEKRTATVRRPDSAAVTLNANSDTASVNEQGLAVDNKEYADIPNKAVKIERQIHNFKLELKNYIKNFTNTDGSKLLGWNKTATSDSYIPEFYADAEVGVNKQGALNAPYNINNLYAVWEPMVYLTLDNATTQAITFNLDFKEHDNSAYADYVMAMTGEYDRVPFGEMSTDKITVTDNGSGSYSVKLQPRGKVQLVVPNGVLNEDEPVSYTVSGDYATANTKNLFIYNSGSDSGVSIEKRSDNSWYLNGEQTTANPIHYENTGTLVKGTQGRLVRFTETGDSSVQVNLTARYYDLATGTWMNADNASGVNAKLHFLHNNTTVTETVSADGATTSATLSDNSTHTDRFGMRVEEKDEQNNIDGYSSDYKFIGWYTVDEAAPNTISVDGHASDPGEATIQPTLAIPTTEKTYYALFVPYVSGTLKITHSQRNDSAGDSADEGLGLSVQYYTDPDEKTDIASDTGDNDSAASVELNKFPNTENVIIDEKNTAGHLVVTVSAKANDSSTYKATYRGQNAVFLRYDADAECYKASFDETVANHFADSDTVKGLKVLKPINYYSVFSRKFEIIYTYTARDGQAKDYTLKGSLDSFKDFDLYVLRHTPYVHTLAGDTVWDKANMSIYDENGIKHAKLCEVSAVRAHCSVTINEAGGYTPTVSVPYGETFTEELALNHKAPKTNSAGQTFAYWDIKNTDTGKHIANCYSPKFTFKVWNNYTITPVYQEEPKEITDEGRFITIDYIDTSRNPWGIATYSEDNDTTDRSQVTDKVVADVDITFVNNGDRIYDNLDEHGNNRYQLGVMFEVVGNTNDGSFDPKDYNDDDEGRLSRVTALLADSNARPSSTKKFGDMTCYYSKINISQNTVSDFNRSEFARSFNAGAVKNYVFRMYAYMVTPEGNKVLSDPHYMTFYGSATPQYALSASGE